MKGTYNVEFAIIIAIIVLLFLLFNNNKTEQSESGNAVNQESVNNEKVLTTEISKEDNVSYERKSVDDGIRASDAPTREINVADKIQVVKERACELDSDEKYSCKKYVYTNIDDVLVMDGITVNPVNIRSK